MSWLHFPGSRLLTEAHSVTFYQCGHFDATPLTSMGHSRINHMYQFHTTASDTYQPATTCGRGACRNTDPTLFLDTAQAAPFTGQDTATVQALDHRRSSLLAKAWEDIAVCDNLDFEWPLAHMTEKVSPQYSRAIGALLTAPSRVQALDKFLPQLTEAGHLLFMMRTFYETGDARKYRAFFDACEFLTKRFLEAAEARVHTLDSFVSVLKQGNEDELALVGPVKTVQHDWPFCSKWKDSWDFSPELKEDIDLLHQCGDIGKELLQRPLDVEAHAVCEGLIRCLKSARQRERAMHQKGRSQLAAGKRYHLRSRERCDSAEAPLQEQLSLKVASPGTTMRIKKSEDRRVRRSAARKILQ
ncbi:hypothetical protein K431DRAFT_281206 [Polychaeton citri CBS 116435]|uniref:Uncharacterized protein n=1 Tax=Polychaeton citri CBS 116435 TaxID=1314669 RepID=A0A9P4QFF1_9PEZI|nr:hypothetical protein K431DRAFT_281206 [Polychaeton citri CBS 116435]